MKPLRSIRSTGQRSFTMVEILVATTVLVLILALLSQMMGIVTRAARQGLDRVDNFTKSRAMLDLVCNDLQKGVFRPDLPSFLYSSATTPSVTNNGIAYFSGTGTNYFYTRTAGVTNNDNGSGSTTPVRSISRVSYDIVPTETPDMIVLQRSSDVIDQTAAPGAGLSFSSASPTGTLTPLQTAPGVVGFRLSIRRSDGTVDDIANYTGYKVGAPVIAVGVSMAVLGNQALTELYSLQTTAGTGTAIVQKITEALADPKYAASNDNPSCKASWDAAVNDSGTDFLVGTGYPKSLLTGFKTFERWVACPPF